MKHEFHTPFIGRLLFLAMGIVMLFPFVITSILFMSIGETFASAGLSLNDAFLQILVFAICILIAFVSVHNFHIAFSRSPTLVLDDAGLYYRTPGILGKVRVNWDQITAIVPSKFITGRYLTVYARELARNSGSENLLFRSARKILTWIFLTPFRFLMRGKREETGEQFSIYRLTINTPMDELDQLLKKGQRSSTASKTHNHIQRVIDQSPHKFAARPKDLPIGTMFSYLAIGTLLLFPITGFLLGQAKYTDSLVNNQAARETQELRALAQAGDADAQNKFGWRLSRGVGAPKSVRRAFPWYLRSAKQGFHKAQYNVGRAYEYGEGTSRDYSKAAEWYQRAAEQNFPLAQSSLGYLYMKGRGVKVNYIEAIALFERAALKNDGKALYQLGWMHEKGLVFEQSRERALAFFEKAASQNYPPAIKALRRLQNTTQISPSS